MYNGNKCINIYTVEDKKYTELAKAENEIKKMIRNGKDKVLLFRNGEPYNVYSIRDGVITLSRIKVQK